MKRINLSEAIIECHYLYCRGKEQGNQTDKKSCYGRIVHYNNQEMKYLDFSEEVNKSIVDRLSNEQYFEKIIKSKPDALIEIENEFYNEIVNKTNKPLQEIQNKMLGFINHIFDYSKFSKRNSINLWTTHKLTELLNVTVCPYCNSQFIFTLKKKSISLRPQLDHFFPKGSHPLLALSIYNLIPSCSDCNASIKGKTELRLEETIHPYIDDFDEIAYFKREFLSTDRGNDFYSQIVGKESDFKLSICNKKKGYDAKIAGFIGCFALEQRINFHKNIVQDEIKKSIVYSESYQMGLKKSFSRLFDVNRSIENILIQDNINNNILSKLKNDIISTEILSKDLPFEK